MFYITMKAISNWAKTCIAVMEKLYDSNRNMDACAQSYDTPVSQVLKSAMTTLSDADWLDIEDLIHGEHVSIIFFG